ncbi:hypothetical protein EIG32_21245 [Escherichia coli O26:H32]|nr:hypothetical protein [Escherichia coli O26:H32]
MAGLRNNNNTQNAQWADYVGDILRGAQPINQLVPQHPYLNDVPLIGNDSNLLIVFYVQIMPDDLVMQLHRF